mmetsp:Transcript_10430/g.26746  ORF Transcript_10430/g.26746 Transcript_10430/m.26746 type:complete len:222 (+) Transcript_10430:411-1076(+)
MPTGLPEPCCRSRGERDQAGRSAGTLHEVILQREPQRLAALKGSVGSLQFTKRHVRGEIGAYQTAALGGVVTNRVHSQLVYHVLRNGALPENGHQHLRRQRRVAAAPLELGELHGAPQLLQPVLQGQLCLAAKNLHLDPHAVVVQRPRRRHRHPGRQADARAASPAAAPCDAGLQISGESPATASQAYSRLRPVRTRDGLHYPHCPLSLQHVSEWTSCVRG